MFFMLASAIVLGQEIPEFEAQAVIPASGPPAVPLAPGLLMSIYGHRLGPLAGCEGRGAELCGVRVFIGGLPVGLLYVQERQINFQVPENVPVTGMAQVRVVFNGVSSSGVSLPLGLQTMSLSLQGPGVVGLPVWLRVSDPHWYGHGMIQYPFTIWPANFGCHDIEVRRDGKLLDKFASLSTQALGGIAWSGPLCGFLGLRSERLHQNRIPLHLQYKFDKPGLYEVRYTLRDGWTASSAIRLQSEWTRIQLRAAKPGERAQWLADMQSHAPVDEVALLEDYLPDVLGIPDQASLRILREYLWNPHDLVRRFAMQSLTYWPKDVAVASILELVRRRGPSDVAVQFLKFMQLPESEYAALAEQAIPGLRSNAVEEVRGAILAMYRFGSQPRTDAALIAAASHVIEIGDRQILNDYVCALGEAKDARAGAVLWDMIRRNAGAEQAAIALGWRKDLADLPKLAARAMEDGALGNVPYSIHTAYGEAAVPYLKELLARSNVPSIRIHSAEELMLAGSPEGFAFAAGHSRELFQFARDRFPDLRNATQAEVATYLRARSDALRH